MSRIEAKFSALAEKGEKAFIPFITAGDPTLAVTEQIVYALSDAGADIIELGVPFSDPLADGVVNQEAAQRALIHDVTLAQIVELVSKIRERCDTPILLFTYYNPVLAFGVEALAAASKAAGVDGALIVDLPPEEGQEFRAAFAKHGLSTVFLLAPTSTDERIELISKNSTGFVYYVSRTGVTGEQDSVESSVEGMVSKIKSHTDLPVAVGFGISKPEHASEVKSYADGVVVGSAIVRLIGSSGESSDTPEKVKAFVQPLIDATKAR